MPLKGKFLSSPAQNDSLKAYMLFAEPGLLLYASSVALAVGPLKQVLPPFGKKAPDTTFT